MPIELLRSYLLDYAIKLKSVYLMYQIQTAKSYTKLKLLRYALLNRSEFVVAYERSDDGTRIYEIACHFCHRIVFLKGKVKTPNQPHEKDCPCKRLLELEL